MNGKAFGPGCPGIGIKADRVALEGRALLLVYALNELLNGLARLNSTELARRSVIVGTTDKKNPVGADQHSEPASVDISGNMSTGQVTNMQAGVGIRHARRNHRSLGSVGLSFEGLNIQNCSWRSIHR